MSGFQEARKLKRASDSRANMFGLLTQMCLCGRELTCTWAVREREICKTAQTKAGNFSTLRSNER